MEVGRFSAFSGGRVYIAQASSKGIQQRVYCIQPKLFQEEQCIQLKRFHKEYSNVYTKLLQEE